MPYSPLAPSPAHRDQVVRYLSAAFAQDRLTLEELDTRLAAVYRAQTVAELGVLLVDPVQPTRSFGTEGGESRLAAPQVVAPRGVLMAFMGGFERTGTWLVPRHLRIVAVMGGGELDLRDARFSPGVTEIELFGLMAGFEIIVPPGVRVECVGVGVAGGFGISGGDATDDLEAPVLRINGFCVMAAAEIRSNSRNKKREKRYREALARAERAGRLGAASGDPPGQ